MNPEVLGGILKKVGNFGMDSFEKRLIFQKTVYFLQQFGIDLGYRFNWYIAGPYSQYLAGDGFKLERIYDQSPEIEIKEAYVENFNKFSEFIKSIRNDKKRLEVLSSIHFLNSLGIKRDKIFEMIKNKKEHFSDKDIEDGYEYLKKFGLIQ